MIGPVEIFFINFKSDSSLKTEKSMSNLCNFSSEII